MKVLFKYMWFGPTHIVNEGKISQASGKRYYPGEQYVAPELRPYLPSTAKVIEEDAVEPVKADTGHSLRDFDELRQESDATAAAEARAQETLLERAERMQRELEVEPPPAKKKKG